MSNSSSDPLASVITQVQPGQGAGPMAVRGAGPTRPTKVAKPGTAKAAQQAAAAAAGPSSGEAKKKKKKKKVREEGADATRPAEGGIASSNAEASTSKAAATLGGTPTASTLVDQSSTEGQGSHSADPVIGASSSSPPAESASAAEAGATPGAAGVGETDAAAQLQTAPGHEQDMTGAAEVLQSSSTTDPNTALPKTQANGNGVGSSAASAPATTAATTTAPSRSTQPPRSNATNATPNAKKQPPPKKKSGLQKFLAFLTCSSGAEEAATREERPIGGRKASENIEMQQRNGKSTVTPTKLDTSSAAVKPSATSASPSTLSPPSKTLAGRAGASRPVSARNSLDQRSETGIVAPAPGTPTAGGGTKLPREETGDVMSGAVVPPGSSFVLPETGGAKRGSATPSKKTSGVLGGPHPPTPGQQDSDSEEETDEEDDEEEEDESEVMGHYQMDDELSEEQRLIAAGGIGIPVDEFGNPRPLLEPMGAQDSGRKCLVLDLDETLVHSSFKMISGADFIVPVEIDGTVHNVYVIKRPGVDEFMRRMGEIYEVVVFTASLSKYADPVLDILDIHRVVRHRLFRESCYNHRGNYVKDLSQLGRPIGESIIIDNSPASYIFHPNNAVPISSWFNDPHDTELTDLCPFLADLSEVHDVRAVLDGGM